MNRQLVEAARSYVGTRFEHQGRLPKLDCVGLVVCAARDIGVQLQDFVAYDRDPDGRELMRRLLEQTDVVHSPELGDIAVFWYKRRDYPQHLAVVSEIGMIHTWAMVDRVVEESLTEFWRKRLVCYVRLKPWR